MMMTTITQTDRTNDKYSS